MSNSNSVYKLPSLSLPDEFRSDLWIPQGTLYVHPSKGSITDLHVDITVGDVVSRRHHSYIKVVDFKTKKKLIGRFDEHEKCNYFVLNPPGNISLNSYTFIDSATRGVICVIGEEDLLTIPFLNKINRKIAYGQPDSGIVVLNSSVEMAIKVFKILKATVIQYRIRVA
ncbi:MAG: DUF359 domain-containing protein [Desulfurococcaceae archaeon]